MFGNGSVGLVAAAMAAVAAQALCPHAGAGGDRAPPSGHIGVGRGPETVAGDGGAAAATVDWSALKKDVIELFHSSQAVWPADYNNYAPLFVRLAWHCSGSYRTSDGRGGCGGGRQRFDPERSWEDNTNLDKARALLRPLKAKYGSALSWGDLFIFTGTTAVEHMGGPILGFCAGRIDDDSGAASETLGPTAAQEELFPCEHNGECKSPLGATTIGLIYVNPAGPDGQPIPEKSAPEVRDTFERMNMNDTETVALIGGGHAFGKTHGACPNGPGQPPNVDPIHPWQGQCGDGKGNNTYTSGLEGPWTTNPTQWDNEYFQNLLKWDWETFTGPAGKPQWRVKNAQGPMAPSADLKGKVPIRMMTSDVSLIHDGVYYDIVRKFASDQVAFDTAFAHAWYKLTSRDMGPWGRCVGPNVPPPQPWQNPLPAASSEVPDFDAVRQDLAKKLLRSGDRAGPLLVRLAWQCASTYRSTDYLGGCNGARIRFAPMRNWPENKDLSKALDLLSPIQIKYGPGLSWADLIVLAGNVAIESAGGPHMSFCPGRVDALDGDGSTFLQSRVTDTPSADLLKDVVDVMGLTTREFVVLLGGGHTLGGKHLSTSGYTGSWTSNPNAFDNRYFTTLLRERWSEVTVPETGKVQYEANNSGTHLTMLPTDMLLLDNHDLLTSTQLYASNNSLFVEHFALAWTKMMNRDRINGPEANVCDSKCNTLW